MAPTVLDLAALVRERQPCVVLTGAGISTESGIPDFRSPGGRGLVAAAVTQNIDGLHQRAGSPEVVEVHGSIRSASCLESRGAPGGRATR